ncbi:hypothetical protein CNMCM6457_002383 [Aspergillus fumigatiaffinis]|nr:hypothetical protein CNMCM6457_002383 [Aspergillus fumigatiaffinis]
MHSDSPSLVRWLRAQCSRRRYQCAFAAAILMLLLFHFHTTVVPMESSSRLTSHFSTPSIAREVSARSLLSRPISKDPVKIPKIIHQTWFPAGSNMSERAQSWVQTMREQNPDWEWVLWDDETNNLLVQTYFPWFWDIYSGLPKEILRADLVRNFYMYLFGGMYADVDTEALVPVEPLFIGHGTSVASHHKTLSSLPPSKSPLVQRAFMGRMSHSDDLMASAAVPNGWMASPPGHPFWLMNIIFLMEHPEGTGDGSVEGLTGPGVLSLMIKHYYENFKNESLRQHVCDRVQQRQPSWSIFCGDEYVHNERLRDALILLPRQQIYPYSWADDRDSVCLAAHNNPLFDADECKRLMDVDAWPIHDFYGDNKSNWHLALDVLSWIFWSNATILLNKWIINSTAFHYPILLTCWHLVFATIVTQVLARTTRLLDGRRNIPMDARMYCRSILPIGLLYCGTLVCSNMVYLYLNISFIQMLKAAGPVVTLITSWSWKVAKPSIGAFINILIITLSVAMAVSGEIRFSWLGFGFQFASLVFDANRLVMVQILLSDSGQKMDPLVSLYYFAPACAFMTSLVAWQTEYASFEWSSIAQAGWTVLTLSAVMGFMLNVSIFLLIGKTSGLAMTLISIPKNILLIAISVILWHTPITSMQLLGYNIALWSLLFYSIGWNTVKAHIGALRVLSRKSEENEVLLADRV